MRTTSREQGRRWLEQAQTDLRWVRHLAEQGAHYLVCFLAQQAAEKALKAVLYARGEELVLGHSVRQLSRRVAVPGADEPAEEGAGDAGFGAQVDRWAILDSYYIPTRYPNGLPDDIPARVYNRESDWFVAKCPELDFVSQGKNREEARTHLMEVIQIQFEEMMEMGTLDDYLAECGYVREDGTLISQNEMIGLEKESIQVA